MEDNYLFILGRQPELSLAELFGYAEGRAINFEVGEIYGSTAVIRGKLPEPKRLMEDLAGVVKIASAGAPLPRPKNINEWTELLGSVLSSVITSKQSLTFGLSFYGELRLCPSAKEQEQLALTLKRLLKDKAKHVRWVSGRGKPLTSVQVAKNKLDTEQGCELVIYCSDKTIIVGKTLAVQAFEDWSERDYNRPRRDAKRGMLPPKLARMMVNMLGLPPRGTLLDPFCGSGTVLMEATMLGWPKLIGADKSARAVKDAKTNTKWLMAWNSSQNTFAHSHECANDKGMNFLVSAAEDLPRRLAPSSIQAIVTEPYLGTPLLSSPSEGQVKNLQRELAPLYGQMLAVFDKLLILNGRAIFILPQWVMPDGKEKTLPLSDLPWPKSLRRHDPLAPLPFCRDFSLVYKRPHQYIARAIMIVEKVSR
ncbi:hypothetical protein A3D60_04125 [Candidatus Uhrbacteria bacterium RIFCSPHIGHO2_02_FULL_47_29]|uniref:Ribosomal RNA large subunit methyltransferase K/L-like methyltransferase domain-containing protein n=1 Tax=Candidatus Uhrbacteria bacterium RIFCSPLOWO2_01_FULL_47_25 TaxID=1802402 RepID=A0A1F7UW90_9BACT|nr:MAG: hypothetical protein A3D60_04125 [Candidatus Uhrbacteria bacterium RIFCSPHIGHO2_02_FULL_47_29]OGL82563.1 MAG: hypothetical protein A2936_03120 [Candidatus Uhrbacteria bacterium RIFCSPLOWO2_01_FULL_47_25]OGL86148.1 MAG: hypothetical protein A3I37_02795 [Candidatus Uhrbacteria bacterium RIFCSPLOWO2_02_FULL_46_19]